MFLFSTILPFKTNVCSEVVFVVSEVNFRLSNDIADAVRAPLASIDPSTLNEPVNTKPPFIVAVLAISKTDPLIVLFTFN